MSDNQPTLNSSPSTLTVTFNYTKSNFHRLIRVDTVRGGITPDGNIYIELCSEKPAMPSQVVLTFDEGEEIGRQTNNDSTESPIFDREIEVSAVINTETALSFAEWLVEMVDKVEDSGDNSNEDDEEDAEND